MPPSFLLSLQLRRWQSDFLVYVFNVGKRFLCKTEIFESFAFPKAYLRKLLKRPKHFGCRVTETRPGRLKKIKTYADKVDVYFGNAQSSGFSGFCKNGVLRSAEAWIWGDCRAKSSWYEKKNLSRPRMPISQKTGVRKSLSSIHGKPSDESQFPKTEFVPPLRKTMRFSLRPVCQSALGLSGPIDPEL